MFFADKNHRHRYEKCLSEDNTAPTDYERKALFYILCGCKCLANRGANTFYNFNERVVLPETLDDVGLSSGARMMLLLALNLFNSWEAPAPAHIFAPLDGRNRAVALAALRLRFQI